MFVQCTTASLAIIFSFETEFPTQSFFGNAFRGATSWEDVKTEVEGKCDEQPAATPTPVA